MAIRLVVSVRGEPKVIRFGLLAAGQHMFTGKRFVFSTPLDAGRTFEVSKFVRMVVRGRPMMRVWVRPV